MLPWALVVAAWFSALTAMTGLQDPDYFWHVRTGELIVTDGLPRTDPFSFTYPAGPWILHEWLGEVALYLGREAVGLPGVVAIWSALIGIALLVMMIAVGRAGGGLPAILACSVLPGIALLPYVSLRPQMLSMVLLAGLVWLLIELRDGRRVLMLALPVLFAAWSNVHGFWSIGLGILAVYVAATWLGTTAVHADRLRLTVCAGAAMLAVLVNPYGFEMLLYPFRYVDAGDWGFANINEWQSPDFHDAAHWPLLALFLFMALVRGRARRGWLEVCAWVTLIGSLYALRVTPIAAIVCGYVLGLSLANVAWVRKPRPPRAAVVDRVFASLLVIGSFAALLFAADADVVPDERSVPRSAVDVLASRAPDARVFAEYRWGGYVIHELSASGGSVFVDGRNDMYPQEVLEDYTAIRSASTDAELLLDHYGATAVLLPLDAPLISRGLGSEWCEVHRSELAILLLREECSSAGQDSGRISNTRTEFDSKAGLAASQSARLPCSSTAAPPSQRPNGARSSPSSRLTTSH